MLTWIGAHGADILVLILVALACIFVLRGIVRRRGSGCGGDCSSCPGSAACRARRPRP